MTQTDEVYKKYVKEMILYLKKSMLSETWKRDKETKDFISGRKLAFYSAIDVLYDEARVLEISLEDVGLANFNPDKKLSEMWNKIDK